MKTILSRRKPNIKSGEHEAPATGAPDVQRGWKLTEMLEAHLTTLDSMVRGFGAASGPSDRSRERNG